MKAFALTRYGKQNSVTEVQLPEPGLRDDDVLVRIHAASVNPRDLKISSGKLKPLLPYKLPLVLGNDLPGVAAVGRPNSLAALAVSRRRCFEIEMMASSLRTGIG